jgi:hypothetical protein
MIEFESIGPKRIGSNFETPPFGFLTSLKLLPNTSSPHAGFKIRKLQVLETAYYIVQCPEYPISPIG